MKEKQSSYFGSNSSQYFQGIIQLRNPTDNIISFMREELIKNKEKGVFLGKEKKVRNGIDLYVSSNKFAIGMGNKLYKKFGGIMKINEKLFSRNKQTSKDLYRVTVLYRPLGFLKGDVVKTGGKVIQVTNIGKKISGINFATGKTDFIDYRKEEIEKLEIFKTTVSKVFPELEVIHPETYQSVKVMNPRKAQPGEKVKVAIGEGVWIVG